MPPKRRGRSHSDPAGGPTPSTERKRQKHEQNHGDSLELCMTDQKHSNVMIEDYSVGWICALSVELAAAKSMLDTLHAARDQDIHDTNAYIYGNIGPHNIVLACLPHGGAGTHNAAIVATHLRRSFPSITLMLMVGIGGGIPGPHNPRLGDVVVGSEVIQYDIGKSFDDHFKRKGIAHRPDSNTRTTLAKFRAGHEMHQNNIPSILRHLKQYAAPDSTLDVLFCSSCKSSSTKDCGFCDEHNYVRRAPRSAGPRIHYGKIASGNQVIRNAMKRDKIAEELLDVLCVDMEAAGVMDSFPCLSIRGLSDYADAYKNDFWQDYAAGTAAACAKEFLSVMPCRRISEPFPASGSNSPLFHKKQSEIFLRGIEAGDWGMQVVIPEANQSVVVIGATVGENGIQAIGCGIENLCGQWQARKIELPDTDDAEDSPTPLMDECTPGYARQ
ncbi:hypothetical protein KAF25_006892 [Fusarium avenaceum]|uniref:Nucleoside phosphorylase domain-containing protein n=1 Tax=Fusarium avenaceum TaxID=40199 RepID=A0A9P7GRD1_9HYPO|nr:hypothetical protein KAF25_006892 [Fusarium avenaceum]